ncbi:MAG: SDR family oxidoreductase [Eubacterium sp.]|nr:SDR family oxidoreductase [Eubacterium sp.]
MINPMSLVGKNIIVTGAASGIGKAAAKRLHELGAFLILIDNNGEKLNTVKKDISDNVKCICCDLTDFDTVRTEIESVRKELDYGFTGMVHCAGIPSIVPLRVLLMSDYEKVQRINVEAGLNLAKIISERKNKDSGHQGSFVFISSVYGVVGSACNVAYTISKAAVVGMTKSLSIELASKGIRVNAIAPGFINSEMADDITPMFDDKYKEEIEAMHPLGWGEPIDIANGIAFLLSDASKWMTGAVLNIDGGFTAR